MAAKQLVLAIFPNVEAAEAAADALKAWDRASEDVKLNAVGILAIDEHGKLNASKVGKRSVGKGAGVGVVLAMLTPVGLVGGIIGGGILGAMHHKGLGLTQADQDRIGGELVGGRAAVGVLATADEALAISSRLSELGGEAEVHDVSDEALDEAATVAATPTE